MARVGFNVYEEKIDNLEFEHVLRNEHEKDPVTHFKKSLEVVIWKYSLSIIESFIKSNDMRIELNKQRLICFWVTHCINFITTEISNIDTDFDIVRDMLIHFNKLPKDWEDIERMKRDLNQLV